MATLNDRVLDSGLSVLDTEANKIVVTSQEATTYTEANATYAGCEGRSGRAGRTASRRRRSSSARNLVVRKPLVGQRSEWPLWEQLLLQLERGLPR